jgi:HYR domain
MAMMPRSTAVAVFVVLAATAAVPLAASGNKAATLDLQARLSRKSVPVAPCPSGSPPSAECYTTTGEGDVRGLGRGVKQSFVAIRDPSQCPSGSKLLGYPARFVVAGKGEINLAVAEHPDCLNQEALRSASQSFTITGGTGIYAGASGSGRVERSLVQTPVGPAGTETYVGTLAVPGHEFDLTKPTISGARSKTVWAPKKANRVRVTFRVTAQDDVDGPLRASCRPASGSRFKVGRTTVKCEARDMSANTATAYFRVTLRRRR